MAIIASSRQCLTQLRWANTTRNNNNNITTHTHHTTKMASPFCISTLKKKPNLILIAVTLLIILTSSLLGVAAAAAANDLTPDTTPLNNTIPGGRSSSSGPLSNNKKIASSLHHQNLNKLQKYLNERQREVVNRYPGSLLAVARALKMAIVECQYQMRHDPWDCPIHRFSVRLTDVFGELMSRSFKETSFVHSLLSSAIAHTVTRACEDEIYCGPRKASRDGFSENIDFGNQFAREFMEATHDLSASSSLSAAGPAANSNNFDRVNLNNNIIPTGSGSGGGVGGGPMESSRRERKIRNYINLHNDEVGRLHVLNGMRRECKCHGLSGACNIQTCWLRLPPFREVASKLHESLDEALRVIYLLESPNRQKSLTSATVKKSNKKRSSIQSINGLKRSTYSSSSSSPSTSSSSSYASSNSLTSDTAKLYGSRKRGTTPSANSGAGSSTPQRQPLPLPPQYPAAAAAAAAAGELAAAGDQYPLRDSVVPTKINSTGAPPLKRRPVARSIGIANSFIEASKLDLLYYEQSPDFCIPNDTYNIKGTKGRVCSESPNAINSCELLCCGRGHKTEVREEKYNCECQFKFCCDLYCNKCTRRKIIHKCL